MLGDGRLSSATSPTTEKTVAFLSLLF
uniref:Uncharacterized protein n=1 Tax=Anguilla anguilla TaxID=7936 RepID=A0A0E9UBA1_ANGAN